MNFFSLSPPCRKKTPELHLFINQRPVKDKLISQAIRSACDPAETFQPHPVVVLFLSVRPDWLDINVHPQKTEIKVLKQEKLFSWIHSHVRKAFLDFQSQSRRETVEKKQTLFSKPTSAQGSLLSPYDKPIKAPSKIRATTSSLEELSRKAPLAAPAFNPPPISPKMAPSPVHSLRHIPTFYSQPHLLFETPSSLVLVEPVLFEASVLARRYEDQVKDKQLDLLPLTPSLVFSLEDPLIEVASTHQAFFNTLGFEYRLEDDGELWLEKAPRFFKPKTIKESWKDWLGSLLQNKSPDLLHTHCRERIMGSLLASFTLASWSRITLIEEIQKVIEKTSELKTLPGLQVIPYNKGNDKVKGPLP